GGTWASIDMDARCVMIVCHMRALVGIDARYAVISMADDELSENANMEVAP
ncbi:hypothetical protein L195_g062519, partial [Trifolium pratense]